MPFSWPKRSTPPSADSDRASDAGTTTHAPPEPQSPSRTRRVAKTLVHHVKKHVGVGVICAVAYFDPYVFKFAIELLCFTDVIELA